MLADERNFDVPLEHGRWITRITSFLVVWGMLTYKFNGDLLVVQQVGPFENDTK